MEELGAWTAPRAIFRVLSLPFDSPGTGTNKLGLDQDAARRRVDVHKPYAVLGYTRVLVCCGTL